MKNRQLVYAIWGAALAIIVGNVWLSARQVHLFVPTVAGLLGIAAFVEWRSSRRIHDVFLAAAAFLTLAAILAGRVGQLSIYGRLLPRGPDGVFRLVASLVSLGEFLGFLSFLLAATGAVIWISENARGREKGRQGTRGTNGTGPAKGE